MRTFTAVFPHTTLWDGGSLMIGSSRPLVLDEHAFELGRSPSVRTALRDVGLGTFSERSRLQGRSAELRAFVGDGTILTDDRPLTEYFLCSRSTMPRSMFPECRETSTVTCAAARALAGGARRNPYPRGFAPATPNTRLARARFRLRSPRPERSRRAPARPCGLGR